MGVQRTFVRGLLLASLLFSLAAPAPAATTIGLYTDENASSCSFSGNQSGVVNAYVVVKPDNLGLSGVRFSAPIPACFGGTWVADIKPEETLTIGESPTGISVAFTTCATEPRFALQIQYARTSTTACCAFPIAADPYVGIIEGTTCDLQQASMAAVTSHFNANASCPCNDPTPPHAPGSPAPANNAQFVTVNTSLAWTPSPLDGDIASYDVYLGTSAQPPLVATVTSPMYQPPQPLAEGALHYWKVVVRDNDGYTASSPIWAFTTRLGNYPPTVPSNPNPSNNSFNVNTTVQLSWTSTDLDNEALTYDLYLGTTSPPPLFATNLPYSFHSPAGLQLGTQYHWRVVARDPHGAETAGPEWIFATRGSNLPPIAPSSPVPANVATQVVVTSGLTWQCSDPDGDPIKFDVYLGTSSPPVLVAQNITTKSFQPPSPMAFATLYFWKIVARDPLGFETTGPIWAFTTRSNQPPSVPSSPSPSNNAAGIWVNPTLMWTSTDELPGLQYDVYFGTANPPPLLAANHSGSSYSLGALTASATYHWKIVARDAQGLTTPGPVWTFFTAAAPTPFEPVPQNAGYGAAPLTLRWSVSKPNGQISACDVYFGTTNPPPLVTSGLGPVIGTTGFTYAPAGEILPGATYYWRIYANDSVLGGMGPLWTFTGALPGDVNNDGALTVDDAACALKVAVGNTSCAVPGASSIADVNCSAGVTASDALCIHRRAIGQTCPFCGESQTNTPTFTPIVTRSSYWQDGNVLHAVLAVQSVPALEAFTFTLRTPTNAPLTSAIRRGASGNFTALEIRSNTSQSQVGAYSLTPADATFATEFIELTFTVSGTLTGYIVAEAFTDDLAGAGQVSIIAGNGKGGGGATPVTFTRFDAKADEGGVRVAWLLHFISTAQSFTLFRHEEGKPVLAITTGDIRTESGAYLDRTVEVGKTYRYEMLVHTVEGDDVRSQLITVSVPTLGLALGPNHPNPFNPLTTIPYYVPAGRAPVRVRLVIYDTSGRAVRVLVDENQAGGPRDVVWRGDDETGSTVSSGIYFCVLNVGNERRTQKLVMLK